MNDNINSEKSTDCISGTENSAVSADPESSANIPENDPDVLENASAENKDVYAPDGLSGQDSEQKPVRTEIVGIKFKKSGKTYYFAPAGFDLKTDDRVIVDTARGEEYGITSIPNRFISNSEIVEPLRSVLRLATPEDTRIHNENSKKEIEAFNNCIALIDKHSIEMKLIDAELAFDRTKLLFYFSSEGRVDFRELVKDLASIYHMRIEMRQIGIRDEAKILGGLGICGRPYCCHTFLSDFAQVSVKMAKEQNLSLNSAKISGACGRLMCCLRYEYDTYLREKELTPKVGLRVMTADGAGTVTDSQPLSGIVKVKLDSKEEDAEAVAFVRDDVVAESEYHGQKLTKTSVKEKKADKEEDYLFSLFESEKEAANDAPAQKQKESHVKEPAEPSQKKNPKQHPQPSKKENAEKSAESNNIQSKNKKQNNGKPFQNKNQGQPQKDKQRDSQPKPEQKPTDGKKKKRFFKPYFKQNKKPKDNREDK